MDKTGLQALLRKRRSLINPADHGFTRNARQGRRALGLTQEQIELLLHRSKDTYRRLEAGRYKNPPEDLLREVAHILCLSEQDWTALWRYSRHEDPPSPLHPHAGRDVPPAWKAVVDGQGHMAYVTDRAWDLLMHNDAFARMFPGRRVPQNTMRWMLLEEDARTVLGDWSTSWVPLVVPQLRAAVAALPDDETLLRLEADVRADPVVGPLYDRPGDPSIHPDGDDRPLNHPELGPGWVSLCASEPLSSPRARSMVLVFTPSQEPSSN